MNLRTRFCSPVTVGFLDCDNITPQSRRVQSFLTRKNKHSFHTISLEIERGQTSQKTCSLRGHSNPILFPEGYRFPTPPLHEYTSDSLPSLKVTRMTPSSLNLNHARGKKKPRDPSPNSLIMDLDSQTIVTRKALRDHLVPQIPQPPPLKEQKNWGQERGHYSRSQTDSGAELGLEPMTPTLLT